MKNFSLRAICLTASLLGLGGVNYTFAQENSAAFDWSGNTLTITGKGDLSKVTVTDDNTKVFSATGAGKVYTKSTTGEETTAIAVKAGDAYNTNTSYYEPTMEYGTAITPSTTDYTDGNGNKYKMTKSIKNLLKEGETFYTISEFTQTWNSSTSQNELTGVKLGTITTPEDQVNQTWGTNGNYYYYAVVTGTVETYKEYKLDALETADYKITIVTTENRNNICPEAYTITSCNDNLYYSSDATNYTWLAKDATVEYTDGMKLYVGTATVGDDAIADNNTYFFTTHAEYLTGWSGTFVEYLPYAVGDNVKTVIIKTEENESKATINNAITRALTKCTSITTLNLQDTYLPELKYVDNGIGGSAAETDPTFYMGSKPGTWEQNVPSNEKLTTLYMPQTAKNTTLYGSYKNGTTDSKYTNRRSLFYCFPNLKNLYLSEGITTLDTYALYESLNPYKLKTLIFPNTLETIKTEAVNGQDSIMVFTFPKGLKVIEKEAFNGTNPKDVYFLGTEAPKVAKFAWGDRNYIANNSLKTLSNTETGEGQTLTVDLSKGVATRNTYVTQNGWMTMLHYPAACTKAQAAKYTDITRTYKKIRYNNPDQDKDIEVITDATNVTKAWYKPGKEQTALYGTGESDITKNLEAPKEFNNEYLWPSTQFEHEWFGGDYNGGYDDVFVGSQYIWPSISMAQRATIVAQNGLLWDGVTTIGQGISKYDSEYTGDGKEYIGLHQFVFAQGDVTTDKTDEWDMTKYADGIWHTICLPFNMTKGQMKEVFGKNEQGDYSHIRLCEFSKVTRTTGEDAQIKLHFNTEKFHAAESDDDIVLKAHVSYMIHAQKEEVAEGEKIVLKNYVTVAGSPEPTNITATDETTNYYFIGNYQTDITMPQYCYFFVKDQAFKFQGAENGKWTAYTSVVQTADGSADNLAFFNGTSGSSKLSTLLDGEGETDGIEKVTIEADGEIVYTSANVYNLNGQLVSTRGKQGLAKGIYVQNGKKFIVK